MFKGLSPHVLALFISCVAICIFLVVAYGMPAGLAGLVIMGASFYIGLTVAEEPHI